MTKTRLGLSVDIEVADKWQQTRHLYGITHNDLLELALTVIDQLRPEQVHQWRLQQLAKSNDAPQTAHKKNQTPKQKPVPEPEPVAAEIEEEPEVESPEPVDIAEETADPIEQQPEPETPTISAQPVPLWEDAEGHLNTQDGSDFVPGQAYVLNSDPPEHFIAVLDNETNELMLDAVELEAA